MKIKLNRKANGYAILVLITFVVVAGGAWYAYKLLSNPPTIILSPVQTSSNSNLIGDFAVESQ